jgi:hypothetical protein
VSDELLRHISDYPARISRLNVFDPETKKTERVWKGQSIRLLLKLCSHANKDRIAYVGRGELMEKTDLNGQSIETFKRRFILAGILTYVGKKSYQGSAPVDCYLIDLPELPPLEEVLADQEIKQRARKAQSLNKASKSVLNPASDNVLGDALVPALDHALPVRHKQELEHEHELQLQLEQVFERYADLKRRNQTVEIRNEKAWCEGVKKNALKEMSPRGDTYRDRAMELLNQGYRAEDIAGFLADGCVNGQNITFWDKRPEFVDSTQTTELATVDIRQIEDDSDVPF